MEPLRKVAEISPDSARAQFNVAQVLQQLGSSEAALPYFERSLAYRLEAGAIDASLFAAISLASTLVALDRIDEARPHLDYAFEIADRIGSPAGRRRAERVRARLTEQSR